MPESQTQNIQQTVAGIVAEIGTEKQRVIPILQAIQGAFQYLPKEALQHVCEMTEITPADITGVSTFYSQFRHKPVGDHIIHVCTGTACHVKGAEQVVDAFCRELDIPKGDDTDPNGKFTVQKVACLGCCTLAPVVQIDSVTYGHVSSETVPQVLLDFLSADHERNQSLDVQRFEADELAEIRVGLGSCCVASGSGDVLHAVEDEIAHTHAKAQVKRVGCVGMCHRTPLLEIVEPNKEPVLYDRVQAEHVPEIMLRHFPPQTLWKRLTARAENILEKVYSDEPVYQFSKHAANVRDPQIEAFLGRQHHIATEHGGAADPIDLQEYRDKGGFSALQKCLSTKTRTEIIEQVKDSGLRGRGGGGFPTGKKWEIAASYQDSKRYLICNGDEGDPGAFMDRMILESYPYRVLEGMLIAAFAVQATEGYLYIRAEYPLAVTRIRHAIAECEKAGLIGKQILGSDFSFHFNIMEGAGAFVCGEESALIASIEGERGMPRFRPPYPAESGLWGHSTLVNNCETFSVIPWIFRHGSDAFKKHGTANSRGTKVFSLAGKIKRGGLIEVPMGITIREIVQDIGGGIEGDKKFKAVQVGGPSGGCIPAHLADIPVDYDALTKVGAMMGSGGLLVMDETDCMVDIARYFLTFTYEQSCGKCTFCRIGTRHMLEILQNLCSGKAKPGDLEKLRELAEKTRQGSLCGLGKTAPNPVLTTLEYFYDEYQAHLQGVCPAKKCQDLIHYEINDNCIGCTICAQKCPTNAIPMTHYKKHEIIQDKCTKCDTCRQVCPANAVEIR